MAFSVNYVELPPHFEDASEKHLEVSALHFVLKRDLPLGPKNEVVDVFAKQPLKAITSNILKINLGIYIDYKNLH